jgi:hypothetical protein
VTDEITREMFQHSTVVIAGLNDHIEALTTENERLRAALAEAAKDIAWCAEGLTSPWAEHALKAEAKARAALTGDEQ